MKYTINFPHKHCLYCVLGNFMYVHVGKKLLPLCLCVAPFAQMRQLCLCVTVSISHLPTETLWQCVVRARTQSGVWNGSLS